MANSYIPIYLETSLDTGLVVGLSSDNTIEDLKREIAATHPVSFPDIGEIIVQAVKTCRQGRMYHLSDSMPVCTLPNGINETLLLYVEAVAAKRERNLVHGKVDGELEIPVQSRIEDMMVNELPRTNKVILTGPLHDSAEDLAHKLNTEKKKKRRKISAEDASMRPESRKGEDELFEGNFVQEPELAANTIRMYASQKVDHPKCSAQVKGESDSHKQLDTNQVSNQGTKENECRTEVPNQVGISHDTSELLEYNAEKDGTVQPSQEANQMVSAVLGGVVREKKKRKKPKGFYSDVPSEVLPIREHRPQVEDNIKISVEKDSQLHEKPGCTIETSNSIPSQHFKTREDLEGSSRAEKDIQSLNQPQNDQIAVANDIEEFRLDDAQTNVLKESSHVVGEDPGVVFGEKKKHKKKKAAITEVSTKELSSRENESCKEKASNSVLEKEISEARAAVFNNAANANSTDEMKERSRVKRKKTKASSSDMPSDVMPIEEDNSERSGDKVHKKNQSIEEHRDSKTQQKSVALGGAVEADASVSCQLEKERLDPEISLLADNQLGIQQSAMADNNKDFGKGTEVIKKTSHVAGEDSGVLHFENRRRKKKKTEQLVHEAPMNESSRVERDDLILTKEIAKETVDADLTKLPAGGDHGDASKGKRKRNKTKAASTDMPPQELSALENVFPKEGESKLTPENKACKEAADYVHFPKNADGVAFLAPNSADPEDPINNISEILAGLKKNPTQPDDKIDGEPKMHLLANVAVDQHQSDGTLDERKDEKRKGKKSSNKTKTSRNTMNLLTGESVIAHDEVKTLETAKDASIIGDDEIGKRVTSCLATQEDGARNQTLDPSMVENSVGDHKKKRKRKQEATNSRTEATIDGATDEANGSIKNSVPLTDASGKKETQINIQKSLREDKVPDNLTSGDKKPSKRKSKVKGENLHDTSLADGMIQNAPNTPEKVQKPGENLRPENHDKEASNEAVETKGPEVLNAPTIEKINFIDYFLHKGADQHADTKVPPTKIEKCSFSTDSMSTSVDTRVSARTKKPTSKLQTTKKPVKNSKVHNPSGNSNDKSRDRTAMGDDELKKDGNMKRLLDDMAFMSDFSTDDEEEARSQLRKPMTAVQKVASKVICEKMDASRKTSAIHSSGLPDGVGSDASTRDDSGSASVGAPMPGKDRARAMMSPSSQWKNEQVADDDVPMSQELAKPMKKFDLSSVLRSSASYKKAKISLSQSQAEDYDVIDMVFETPQDLGS